jgi:hypothetical protein
LFIVFQYFTEKKSQILYNIPANLPDCKDLPEETTTTVQPSATWDPSINGPSAPNWNEPMPMPVMME